jgi:hypothetical protein
MKRSKAKKIKMYKYDITNVEEDSKADYDMISVPVIDLPWSFLSPPPTVTTASVEDSLEHERQDPDADAETESVSAVIAKAMKEFGVFQVRIIPNHDNTANNTNTTSMPSEFEKEQGESFMYETFMYVI